MDKLAAGIERVAEEADKAIDKGKTKVGEMQIELQMDGLAKKLGYLVFDFYRGREVDAAQRQKLLDELSQLEDKLLQARAEAAAKAEAEAAQKAQQTAQAEQAAQPAWTPPPASGDAGTQATGSADVVVDADTVAGEDVPLADAPPVDAVSFADAPPADATPPESPQAGT